MLGMISCRRASELMSQQLDRKLSLGEKLRLHTHLMICKSCPQTLQQFEILRMASKQFGEHVSKQADEDHALTADSRERILSKLKAQDADTPKK